MKTEIILGTSSIQAAVDLVKHRFIDFDGSLCAQGNRARGVSAADTKAGQMCPINIAGEVLVEAGEPLTKGIAVMSDAYGRAIPAPPLSVSVPVGSTPVTSNAAQPVLEIEGGYLPRVVNGYAVDSASAAGELIRVKLV